MKTLSRRLAVFLVLVLGASACGGSTSEDDAGSTADEAAFLDEPVFLEAAADLGADPFLVEAVSARPDPAVALPVDPDAPVPDRPTNTTARASGGGDVGLYGGSTDRVICDQEKMIGFLTDNPTKAAAWVAAFNADPTFSFRGAPLTVDDIEDYINSLAPLVLTVDTRVTNHGFKDGQPTPRQSVVQKGTAVLVDEFGVPRVKCLCGNPLLPPKPTDGKYEGSPWPDFEPDVENVVDPNPEPLAAIPAVDLDTGDPLPVPVADSGTGSGDSTTSTTTTEPEAAAACTVEIAGVTASPGDEVPIGGDTGQIVRVNDDCTETVANCYFTDDAGVLQPTSPGGTFEHPSGDTYTFNPDCTFDTGAPPTTTAQQVVCEVTLPGGSTLDLSPGDEIVEENDPFILHKLTVTTGFWIGVNDDCTTKELGCAISDTATGQQILLAYDTQFPFDDGTIVFWEANGNCSIVWSAPTDPLTAYCTPTTPADSADITFRNNTSEAVFVWWHDFDCKAMFGSLLNAGDSFVQPAAVGDIWTFNRADGSEVSMYSTPVSGAQTACADPNSNC